MPVAVNDMVIDKMPTLAFPVCVDLIQRLDSGDKDVADKANYLPCSGEGHAVSDAATNRILIVPRTAAGNHSFR